MNRTKQDRGVDNQPARVGISTDTSGAFTHAEAVRNDTSDDL
jgi:hypothetical protein